jgi:hypothetical protein
LSQVVDGDVSAPPGPSEEGGGSAPYFDQVDEGIAAPDNTGIAHAYAFTGGAYTLAASPGDLNNGSVTSATFQLRHRQSGRSDDTMTWGARLETSAGVILAAADSGGTYQNVGADNPYRTIYGNNAAVSFGYINTGATKTQWDDARVSWSLVKSALKGTDSITWYYDTFDISLTYTPTAAPIRYVNPVFRFSPTGRPEWPLPTPSPWSVDIWAIGGRP